MSKIRKALKVILPLGLLSLAIVLVFDYFDSFNVPRFRRSDDSFKPVDIAPSREGLDDLHVSGSKRPSPQGLKVLLGDKGMPVYIFDLQCEGHYYLNGSPQAWYGYRWDEQVGGDARSLLIKHYARRLIYTGKLYPTVEDAEDEKEAMAKVGFNYLMIPVSRGTIPTASQVDTFIESLDALPQPSWVHFHCYNGAGRTSIAMIMFDTLRNGKNLPIEEIALRQHLLGSENVLDTVIRPNGTYTKAALERRRDFLIAFHHYVTDPQGYGHFSWKEWSGRHDVYRKIGFPEGAE